MPLKITPVSGREIILSGQDIADPRLRQGFSRHTGLQTDNQVTFHFDKYLRARLPELEALAGLGVTQTINRAKKIQLTSLKPCKFVRFTWEAALAREGLPGFNDAYKSQQIEGVFTVEAQLEGMRESLALTIYRGDWLYRRDGSIERFA